MTLIQRNIYKNNTGSEYITNIIMNINVTYNCQNEPTNYKQ